MPPLAVAGALLLVAGAATWAGGALAAKAATRQVFTWAGVEHAFIDRLELVSGLASGRRAGGGGGRVGLFCFWRGGEGARARLFCTLSVAR